MSILGKLVPLRFEAGYPGSGSSRNMGTSDSRRLRRGTRKLAKSVNKILPKGIQKEVRKVNRIKKKLVRGKGLF